jgi:ATP-dependent Lon protease
MSESTKPSRSLPESPSEEHLRKEAKRVAKRHGIVLSAAQRRLAHGYGFRNWAEMMLRVKQLMAPAQVERAPDADRVFPFLPLRELVAFPNVVYPIFVGRPMSVGAIRSVEERKLPIIMAAQKDAMVASPSAADIYEIGVMGALIRVQHLSDGTLKALIECKKRVRVTRLTADQDFFRARADEIAELAGTDADIEKILESVASAFVSGRFKSLAANRSIFLTARGERDISRITDTLASYLPIAVEEKQKLLETINPVDRLKTIAAYLSGTAGVASNPA